MEPTDAPAALPHTTLDAGRRTAPALDAVRALAVAAVVVFHADSSLLPGGYVGVDVFFVVSGFLITALLLNEGEASGSIDLRRFWLRRIRRLAPAVLLLVAVVATATLAVGRDTAAGLRMQVLGALTWSSNWVQGLGGRSYVDTNEPQVFTHLWSLAVEEQFYVVWPLLLIALLTLLRASRRHAVWVVVGLAVASAGAMAWTWATGSDPTRAYMFTDSHAFGLLLGAALALSRWPSLLRTPRPHFRRIRPMLLTVAALAALALLGVAARTMRWAGPTPYVGGLLLVSAASVVVVLAACNPTPFARALDNPVLRWVGRRSYGIYLWHWPLIVLAARIAPPRLAGPAAWTAVGLAVVVAALSFRFVETPVRRDGFRATLGRWFGPLPGTGPQPGSAHRRVVLALAVAVAGSAGYAVEAAPSNGQLGATLARGQAAIARSKQSARQHAPAQAAAARTDSWFVPALAHGHDQQLQPRQAKGVVACRKVRNGAAVSAFGDSVLVAGSPELLNAMPRMRITAQVGWQYDRVARAVRAADARGELRRVVVIASGTNGVLGAGALQDLVRHLEPGRRVVLVTPYVPRSWGPPSVRAVHAVARHSRRVVAADWHQAIAGRTRLLAPDHVHPGPRAGRIYTRTVQHALRSTCSQTRGG